MRIVTTLLFSIILFTLTACEDKKENKKYFPEINSTAKITKKSLQKHTTSKKILDINHSQHPDTFTLQNTKNKSYTFSISNKNIYSYAFHKKTIILNISHLSNPASVEQMESLSKLQTKYQSDIIIISLLLGVSQNISNKNIFLNRHHVYHFVSFSKENEAIANLLYSSLETKDKPVPLTVIYKEGKYYSHFKGETPLEMINHDIKQIIKR